MAEHSASDREGVGSSPTSGPHLVNSGYAISQLAKALSTAENHEDETTRKLAQQKADKWVRVFSKMIDGSLNVGSRTPHQGVPEWVTLEVVTGGFSTGAFLAGGELLEHERALAAKHGLVISAGDRLALNRYFLSQEGITELQRRLQDGTYEISVPEEGALLVVAWLIENGFSEKARQLLDEIGPYFSRLRFFPVATQRPQRNGSQVFVQNVGTTIKSLREIRPKPFHRDSERNDRRLDAVV